MYQLGSQPLKRVTEEGLLKERWVGLKGLRSTEKHKGTEKEVTRPLTWKSKGRELLLERRGS